MIPYNTTSFMLCECCCAKCSRHFPDKCYVRELDEIRGPDRCRAVCMFVVVLCVCVWTLYITPCQWTGAFGSFTNALPTGPVAYQRIARASPRREPPGYWKPIRGGPTVGVVLACNASRRLIQTRKEFCIKSFILIAKHVQLLKKKNT